MAQKYFSELLLTVSGIQPRVTRRTWIGDPARLCYWGTCIGV